jgi:AraC-like DNA-binding protein
MRSLMTEALSLPIETELDSRGSALMEQIGHELRRMLVLPLSLRYPAEGALAARCREFVRKPAIYETIDDWASDLHMSRRAFTRLFRRETGLSFMAWRQQACLIGALPRLSAGEPSLALRWI